VLTLFVLPGRYLQVVNRAAGTQPPQARQSAEPNPAPELVSS
jgi:hypothetical protein